MKILSPHKVLLLIAFILATSCSTEPAVQTDKAVVEQAKETPDLLDDVVIASEDEVPGWTDSNDKAKSSSQKTDSDK